MGILKNIMNRESSKNDSSPEKDIKPSLEERKKEEEQVEEPNVSTAETAQEPATAQPDTESENVESPTGIERVAKERDEYLVHLQRLQAEFDNFRKRIQRERIEMKEFLLQTVFTRLLEVVENLERALHPDHKNGDIESFHEGVEMVYRQLMSILGEYGLTKLETEGQPFDPNLHEAVGQVSAGDSEPGTIVNELSPGYCLKDRVLKAPKVQIAAPAQPSEPDVDRSNEE